MEYSKIKKREELVSALKAKIEENRMLKKELEIVKEILQGKRGPMRDIVLLNASAAIYVGGKANNIKEGIELAKESIDSGKAYKKLNEFIEATLKWA